MKIKKLRDYLPFIKIGKGFSSHQFHHKIKLSLLFIIPLAISISGALFQIDKLTTRSSQLANLGLLTDLTVEISHLLHELQKERDYAGVYITTKGTSYKSALFSQRELARVSNSYIVNLLKVKDFSTNSKFDDRLKSFSKYLVGFEKIRQQVDNLAINETEAIQHYSHLNKQLIYMVTSIVQLTVDSELTQAFSAYTLFLKGKESVAIERSIFSSIFARGYFLENEYNELVKLKIEQELFFHEFEESTSKEFQESFDRLFNEQVFQSIRQIKNNALVDNNISIDVTDWFNVTTNKTDKLGLLGDKISIKLIANANRLKQSSEHEIFYWLTALITLYLITCSSGVWLIVRIHRTETNKIKEYQGLFAKNSAAMLVVHAKSHNILYGNRSFSKLTGYDQRQLSTLNVANLHRKKDFARLLLIFKSMVSGDISVNEKILFIRKDNTVFFADIFVFPIIIDREECLAAHVVDITNKLQAKQHIEQSELTLQMVLDSISSAVVVLEDKKNLPVYMNKKAIEIYQNKGDNESVWSLFEQSFFSILNDDFEHDSIIKKKYFNKSKQRWYQITSNVIDWSDGRIVCLKMLKDITESCDAEFRNKNLLSENRRLLCRNYLILEQERTHIAKELHDELGQLLTGIKLQTDFISRQTDKGDLALQNSAQSIIQATNELIKSTRNITNNLRPITLDHLGIIDALEELVQSWRDLNKSIKFELTTESLPYQLSDELEISLYRMVQEGLTNACKHADAHCIEIRLEFTPLSHDKNHFVLELKIKDDGKGFTPSNDNSNGVGIINMRERTEAFNGVFCIIDKQNQGAEIVITIPLEPTLQETLCH